MLTTQARLLDLLGGVRVTSATSFAWHQERVELPIGSDVDLDDRRTVRLMLVDHLERYVYLFFYLTGGRQSASPPRPRPWLSGSPTELSGANAGVRQRQPGWRRLGGDRGCIVVERDGLRVWARPDDIVDNVDGTVCLRVPVDLPSVDPGFHCACGETPDRENAGPVDRFYWNLRPDGAVPLVRMLTERLNESRVPFFLKVIADPMAFGRADAGVLMASRSDRATVVPVVGAIYSRLARHLDPPTPGFTKSLAPGLGFARDPGDGTSFGSSRSAIVAESLVAACEGGEHGVEARLAALRRAFEDAGLDLDRPHLGPGDDADTDLEFPTIAPDRPDRRRSSPSFPETALMIGRRLCDDALWSNGRCTWLGPPENNHPGAHVGVPLADVGPALYEGTAGIALFLSELAVRTGDARARRAAIGAVRQALARCADVPTVRGGGLFGGWAGIAVASAYVGHLLSVPELVESGVELMAAADDPEGVDVCDGRAGAVIGLVTLAGITGNVAHIQRARALAARLADSAEMDIGLELVGALHGIAGIVLALDAVVAATGDPGPGPQAARLRAMLPARSVAAGISWCHGLAGIVRVLRADHAPAALERLGREIREHLDARHPDLSLCHGTMGAADALVDLAARDSQSAGRLLNLAREVGEAGRRDSEERGHWPCGILGEPPGLMLGLAGIGLEYLRLDDPQVCSPLAFGWRGRLRPSQTAARRDAPA